MEKGGQNPTAPRLSQGESASRPAGGRRVPLRRGGRWPGLGAPSGYGYAKYQAGRSSKASAYSRVVGAPEITGK